jgi:hypothetical protein
MKLASSEITQIIVAIIGLLGLISQSIIAYLLSKDSNTDSKPKIKQFKQRIKKNPQKYKWINLIIAITFIFFFLPGSHLIYNRVFVEPSVSIISPHDMQSVNDIIDIEGKCRNIRKQEQLIWITIYSYTDEKYFFHKSSATIDYENDKWKNIKTVIGTPYDLGKKFEILVVLVDINSDTFFEIKKYNENPNSHGLDKLPDKCCVLKKISVFIK